MAGVTNTNARSTTIDTLLSTTWDEYHADGEFQDAIYNSNFLFHRLYSAGKVKKGCNGHQCVVNLHKSENTNATSVGPYDVFPTDAQDPGTEAISPWCEYVFPVVIDRISKVKNSGKAKIVDLVETLEEQARMTAIETLGRDIFDVANISNTATGNGGKNIQSLPFFICNDGVTRDPCGIDTGANTWWANKFLAFGATNSYDALLMQVQQVYLDCSEGTGGAPNFAVCDRHTWGAFERAVYSRRRYTSGKSASAGFPTIMYHDMEIGWDTFVPDMNASVNYDGTGGTWADGSMFFLNDKFIQLKVMAESDFEPTGFQRTINQLASVNTIVFAGQLMPTNRRKLGLLYDVDDALIVS